MVNWKFWERGDNELGMPELSSTPGSLDFTQNYEPPAADPYSTGMPPMPQANIPSQFPPSNPSPFQPSAFSQAPQPSFQQHEEPHPGGLASKDLEVITAKLDAIRAQLETMQMRLTNIEQRMPPPGPADPNNPRRPWY